MDFKSTALPVRTSPPHRHTLSEGALDLSLQAHSAENSLLRQMTSSALSGVILPALLAPVNSSFSRLYSATDSIKAVRSYPPTERIELFPCRAVGFIVIVQQHPGPRIRQGDPRQFIGSEPRP